LISVDVIKAYVFVDDVQVNTYINTGLAVLHLLF